MNQLQAFAAIAVFCACCGELVGAPPSIVDDHVAIDGVQLNFGETIDVSGVCLERVPLEYDLGEASIRAVRINGRATQAEIVFRIGVDDGRTSPDRAALEKLLPTTHYRVRGKLMDARISGLNDTCSVLAESVEEIAKDEVRVADFLDREATLEGLAAADGKLKYGDDTVRVAGVEAWTKDLQDRHLAVSGVVRKDAQGFWIQNPEWRLYLLEEMTGQPVVLDGVLKSLNDNWWFLYRGQRLYLISTEGPALRFGADHYNRHVRVSGELVQQVRPSFDQISLKSARDLVPTYVIRAAKVELRDDQLTWEQKFGTLYLSRPALKNGVPDLLPEISFRRNLLGNETFAKLFAERNRRAMEQILRKMNDEHRDELARRMQSAETNKILRLIYAAILANVNDERGRAFLLEASQVRDGHLDLNAVYCLGVFSFLANEQNPRVETAWAEKPILTLLADSRSVQLRGRYPGKDGDDGEDDPKLSVAEAVVSYSSILDTLRVIGSDTCRKALWEVVAAKSAGSGPAAQQLLNWKTPPSPAELLKIDALLSPRYSRRELLDPLLAQKAPEALDRFEPDLKDSFVYMEFRDHLTSDLAERLKSRLERLDGEAKTHAQMLIVLAQKQPAPELIKLLADPAWADKNLVLFELARLGDPDAVKPVARYLHETTKAIEVNDDEDVLRPTNTVDHAIQAIAHAGSAEAIGELIELLPVDLSKFGGYIKREEWPLVVAAHLIELTGESFGTDVDRWRAWQKQHPQHSVSHELSNPARGGFRKSANGTIDIGN